ncbi:MAG: prolipoprotein diacylglyceryl transferase [Gammaproteobacteria bacterium]|nr:prolipoprotein diacylglyceryl transferase [Gammaproteobacteria bacterium]
MTYPMFDPVAFEIGPLTVHWYGLMYLFGLAFAFGLAWSRASRPDSPVSRKQVEDLITYGAFGVILGGRMGYVFFYGFDQFLSDPLWLFRVWEGGMSFHGGLLGVIFACGLFARKINRQFFDVMDFVAPLAPIGLGLGRLGNFIGQELWGREAPADFAYGMVFPADPAQLYRYPSQLAEAFLEGLVLFIILFLVTLKPRPRYLASGVFLLGYGIFRFWVEFYREPDPGISAAILGDLTRGQELCVPMILGGVVLLVLSKVKQGKS